MDENVETIKAWHNHELAQAYAHPEPTRLLMGTMVWGEPYTYDFAVYGLRSIISRENRAALDFQGWSLVLYVDEHSRQWLEAATEARGLPCQFRMIPAAILAIVKANANYKYPLLASVHNALIHEAGRIDAGFHMLVADVVYSERYFVNLMRLGAMHGAIPHTGFAVERSPAIPMLDRCRRIDGTLRISARDLGQIGWDYLNEQWRGGIIESDDFSLMPYSDYYYFRGQDRIHIHAPHQTAAWISPAFCRQVTPALGGTIDSELPRYMGAKPYLPTLADEMTFIALGGAPMPVPKVPFDEFKTRFWQGIGNNRDFLPYFTEPCPVPLATIDHDQPSAAALRKRMDSLMARLEEQ